MITEVVVYVYAMIGVGLAASDIPDAIEDMRAETGRYPVGRDVVRLHKWLVLLALLWLPSLLFDAVAKRRS